MKHENETKKRIRESALRLFDEKSFEEVTINEICKESGITKHTFYYYFKSKDDLLDNFYKIPCGLSMEEFTAILSMDSYVEQLWMISRKLIDFVKENGTDILRQIMIKNLSNDKGTFSFDTNEIKEVIRLQISIIEKAKKSGQILSKISSKDLVGIYQQIFHSTMFIWIVRDGDFDFEKYLRYKFEILYQVDQSHRKAMSSGMVNEIEDEL
ncbi:TetR/AcrR family transcriptional regulator [Proteocatella sphenisci]|uniref:TetR/AcrR family transcriptional regulator n=1 Tax=Proteocatella sphenisci TaxID=181070 RepID=UPI00048B562C|nr:TetR/AcrR family transcriptional regulator [Proteocatella sphenisci]